MARQSPGSPLRISAGRLLSPSLASVNVFDGVLAEALGPRLGGGLFVGSQPGIVEWEYSREIGEFGGYLRYQNGLTANHHWSMTGGGVSSSTHGVPNRDYMFLRAQWNDPRIFGYVSQEADVNRGWRRTMASRSGTT